VRVLEGVPPGRELAWAYANLGATYMLVGRSEEAVEASEKAQALGECLHEPGIVSNALATIGAAILNSHRDGMSVVEQALRIALDADLHEAAGFAYSALHEVVTRLHRFEDEERYYTREWPTARAASWAFQHVPDGLAGQLDAAGAVGRRGAHLRPDAGPSAHLAGEPAEPAASAGHILGRRGEAGA
jgi:tetratricopeptide (TPR) repeat protein